MNVQNTIVVNSNLGGWRFGYTENGNPGWKAMDSDIVIPFKDMPEYFDGIAYIKGGADLQTYTLPSQNVEYTLIGAGGCGFVNTEFSSNLTFTKSGFTTGHNRTQMMVAFLQAAYCLTTQKDSYFAEEYSYTSATFIPPYKEGYEIMNVFFLGSISAYQRQTFGGISFNKATSTAVSTEGSGKCNIIYHKK